jgi:hypothetical protein
MTDHYTNCIRMTYYRDDDEYDRAEYDRERLIAESKDTTFPVMVERKCCRNWICPKCCGMGSYWEAEK